MRAMRALQRRPDRSGEAPPRLLRERNASVADREPRVRNGLEQRALFSLIECAVAGERRDVDEKWPPGQRGLERLARVLACERVELCHPCRSAAPALRWPQVDEPSAANGAFAARVAH